MRFLFLLFLNISFASEVAFKDTDFVLRGINFIIFAIILYLLFNKRLRAFLSQRTNRISQQLNEVQIKLKQTKNAKEKALKQLQIAKENALEITNQAKKEIYVITQNIETQNAQNIQNMIKSTDALIALERKKMEKQVVSEVLEEIFAQNKLSEKQYVQIIDSNINKGAHA
ncbi:MAG: hypothetical protein E7K04_04720 [Helicobacter sp.]|nr:hypothetical protein [Helicobacter sp.]